MYKLFIEAITKLPINECLSFFKHSKYKNTI